MSFCDLYSSRHPLNSASNVTSQANCFWRPEVNETCAVTSFPPYLDIVIADFFHTFIRTSVVRYIAACASNRLGPGRHPWRHSERFMEPMRLNHLERSLDGYDSDCHQQL